jgi:protein-tyrosine-phosphatase
VTRAPQVLFVCVHNAGRSQMAAALLERLAADRIRVRSAGTEPATVVNPVVVEAMAEIGIDLGAAAPTMLSAEAVEASDVVVTMGCGDACPVFPATRYLDWELDDPSGRPLDDVRRIRDEIERRVRGLAEELVRGANATG